MKKRITMLLCTAVVLLGITVPPALAAGGPYYPVSVEEYTSGPLDELRINKVYQLSLSDDPSAIPTADFERDGRRYYLLDLIQEDDVGVDTRDYTDTITQDSDTKDLSVILKQLDPHREITTEDGYTGLLALDYTSVTVEAKGYKTSTRSLSATRTYPNLSDADTSLIPRTIQDGGRTLTLADVQWQEAGGFYNASATYSGTASSKYATGYIATVEYKGEVTRTSCDTVLYTATFASHGETQIKNSPQPTQAPAETGAPVGTDSAGMNWAVLVIPAALLMGLAGFGGWKLVKYMKNKKRGYV